MLAGKLMARCISPCSKPNTANITATLSTLTNLCYVAEEVPMAITLRNSETLRQKLHKDSCTLKGVAGFRGPPSTVAPGLWSLEGTGFGIRFGCSRLQTYKTEVNNRYMPSSSNFYVNIFKLTRILPIFVHTLFFEQLPCQHTSASSWLASSYTSQLCISKHLSAEVLHYYLMYIFNNNNHLMSANISMSIKSDEQACIIYNFISATMHLLLHVLSLTFHYLVKESEIVYF